jgi:3D (Asp-Asp-Asp) domain-containing protein
MNKLIHICVFALLFVLPFTTEISYSQINNFKSNLNIPEPIYSEQLNKNENRNNKNEIMEMIATAYTQSVEEGTSDGITKSGVPVERGIVAVDPRVIPLGTKLYIEGYGDAVALDIGGAIKGNRIDLFMESKKDAFEWGRRKVNVYIIE